MILGTIYIVWVAADDFLGIFQGFLITLGVPMAAWCGVFLADLMLRRRDYDEPALYTARGRYGAVGWPAADRDGGRHGGRLGTGDPALRREAPRLARATCSNLFGFGGKTSEWAFASLGVPIALAIGFVGYLLLGAVRVRSQERV